ncbi:hypothetical protein [Maridesulfovibrio sp.]|uniref:hypothetical protein n=1 Tax=unclassified Maridesulfovibrio TaxID=2794999 RepID=UPI003B003617
MMQTSKHAGKGHSKPIFVAALCLLTLIITGCSGANQLPGQPFLIPFDSEHITTEKQLSVSIKLFPDGSDERSFKHITHHDFYFDNKNCTASVRMILNRTAKVDMPEIGDWSTVSVGQCIDGGENIDCFTAHIDCHLVRTTFIPTGKRSLAVIRVRNRAREPQELCKQWEPHNLSPDQQEEVENFNRTSDSLFKFE